MGLTINFELKTKFKKKIFLWKILIVPKKRNSKVEFNWNIFEKIESGNSKLQLWRFSFKKKIPLEVHYRIPLFRYNLELDSFIIRYYAIECFSIGLEKPPIGML